MKAINCSYIYDLALDIDVITALKPGKVSISDLLRPYRALRGLIDQDLFNLDIAKDKAQKILNLLDATDYEDGDERVFTITDEHLKKIQSARYEFETVLTPELDQMAVFIALPKRAYDIRALIWSGEKVFDPALLIKAPEVQEDVSAACRCVAFELPTAAVFHLFRATERVVLRYLVSLTGQEPQSSGDKTLGAMISAIEKHANADKKINASLRDLKDLHRNPAIHPEETVKSVDDAIAVLNAIQAPITYMLKVIPEPQTK